MLVALSGGPAVTQCLKAANPDAISELVVGGDVPANRIFELDDVEAFVEPKISSSRQPISATIEGKTRANPTDIWGAWQLQ